MKMNSALKDEVDKASRLPDADQARIAAVILEELEDEAKWDRAFENSQSALKRLADEALEGYRAGRTDSLDPDLL